MPSGLFVHAWGWIGIVGAEEGRDGWGANIGLELRLSRSSE